MGKGYLWLCNKNEPCMNFTEGIVRSEICDGRSGGCGSDEVNPDMKHSFLEWRIF